MADSPQFAQVPAAASPISADDAPIVQEFIAEAMSHLQIAEAELLKIEVNPRDLEAVNSVFRGFHTIKGAAGFLNLRQVGELAHGAEALLDLARKGQLPLTGRAADLVLESMDRMKALIGGLEEAMENKRAPAIDPAIGELLERLQSCAAPQTAPAAQAPASTVAQPAAAALQGAWSRSTVKVATDRLDSLINRVGELVIAHSMLGQDLAGLGQTSPRLARNVTQVSKISRELQDLAISMRMVPVRGTFQRMARVVRDLARKAGKEVELVTEGEGTELDRNLVEAIEDPLMHMARNAVDHGIEIPEQRAALGKARAGRIRLKAFHHAGHIVIQIEDDGRGLDRGRILAKAVEAGIVAKDQQLNDDELFGLIFRAGFSTAETVTDVSGRGMGMDVVRRNIEALRGRIDINSQAGHGCTFTLRLPLTLALIDGLLARVGTETYVVPLHHVEQSMRPTAAQLSTVHGRGELCVLRGQALPIFRLHRLFNVNGAVEDPTQGILMVVCDHVRRCCLLVDQLLGQRQVVIKTLGAGMAAVPGVSGGAILGDGNVSLILDVPTLIDRTVAAPGGAVQAA